MIAFPDGESSCCSPIPRCDSSPSIGVHVKQWGLQLTDGPGQEATSSSNSTLCCWRGYSASHRPDPCRACMVPCFWCSWPPLVLGCAVLAPGICVKMAPNVLPVLGEGGSGALLVLLGKLVGVGAEQVCSEFSPD